MEAILLHEDIFNLEGIIYDIIWKHAKTKDELQSASQRLHDAVESAISDFVDDKLSEDPDSEFGDYDPEW